MKKICVVTATRAEFGLLWNVMKRIEEDPELELCLAVTGAHLLASQGNTLWEIEESGIPIAEKIPILEEEAGPKERHLVLKEAVNPEENHPILEEEARLKERYLALEEDNSPAGICRAMGRASARFGEFYARQKPDLLVVLGDRYELIPICSSALQFRIPIAHISGGEVTAGALDELYRHAVTKMSHLHFPGCETYRMRIIQMGEDPSRVFNYGDVGVENILKMDFMEKKELEESIGFSLDRPYACVTFHPPTMEGAGAFSQIREVLEALEAFLGMKFILTKANADAGGRKINEIMDRYAGKHENWKCFSSLGVRRYLSALKYCEMVIGNSSSGIVEAPCFHIPTVNIGSRQQGRLQAASILNCPPAKKEIISAMKRAQSRKFRETAKKAVNPYGNGDASRRIVAEIKKYLEAPDIQKTFYDVEWSGKE